MTQRCKKKDDTVVSLNDNVDDSCNETVAKDENAVDNDCYLKIVEEFRYHETADKDCDHEIADQIFMSPKQSISSKEKNTKEQILPEYLVPKSIHDNFYNRKETNAVFIPAIDANVSYLS